MDATRRRAHAAVLELLERRHGFGVRAAGCPAWVTARLDRALDALAAELAAPAGASAVAPGAEFEAVIEVLARDGGRLAELAELLRVGETRFYRDPAQWDALRARVLPALCEGERIRALSVGCSTGEETWTLAMLLADCAAAVPATRRPSVRVVGMDRSDVAVDGARAGVYAAEAARHVPRELAERYLEADGSVVRVAPQLQAMASFVVRDAMTGPPPGHFELIVCKNVLIYFGDDAARRAVELMLRALDDRGLLLVAKSEVPRLRALGARAEEIAPGVTAFRG